ncbi:MAG TPA: hypothetical protein ENK63_02860 [Rhodobacterales bacterium]|nr:hypothetical protein [Rhodobacterales bacterium]
MEMQTITVALPPRVLSELTARADANDVTPGELIRHLVQKEVSRTPAKTPNRADEQLVARLQRLLAPTMASATSWGDLRNRLSKKGYEVRPAGGGLTLHDRNGTRLCKSSELGFAYARFVKRFNAAMPGHPHKMQHLLAKTAAEEDPGDRFEFFEPF